VVVPYRQQVGHISVFHVLKAELQQALLSHHDNMPTKPAQWRLRRRPLEGAYCCQCISANALRLWWLHYALQSMFQASARLQTEARCLVSGAGFGEPSMLGLPSRGRTGP